MALARFERPVQDAAGNLITAPGFYFEVRREDVAGTPKKKFYSDRAGVSQLDNPSPLVDGLVAFHAAGGPMSVRVYGPGYDETWHYVAIGTGGEVDADQLLIPGYLYEFETATSAPPGDGGILADNVALNLATRLYISATTVAGVDVSSRITALLNKRVLLTSTNAGEQVSWQVDNVISHTTYYELVISAHVGATSAPAGRMGLQTEGATGATGANGILNGLDVTLTNASETLVSGYQGKTVLLNRSSALALTATAAATLVATVGGPYMAVLKNINTGTVTFDPAGAETVDGQASIAILPGDSVVIFTEGTTWRTLLWSGNPLDVTRGGTGAATAAAALFNLRGATVGAHSNLGIAASVSSNALTVSIKGIDGNNPSATNPVVLAFRNATLATGTPTLIALTAALSITISSGSTLGFVSSTAGRLWLVAFNDVGTVRLGLINCLNSKSVVPLRNGLRASSTAEGGAGAADNAGTFYTGTAVTSRDYIVLGSLDWASGLATAGTWASGPTTIAVQAPGMPLPGDVIQVQRNDTGAIATGSTIIPLDDTIPKITEGNEYMTQSITCQSAMNAVRVTSNCCVGNSTTVYDMTCALFQDSASNALAATHVADWDNGRILPALISYFGRVGTASSTTFRIRAGADRAGTTSFNGVGGARRYGGVCNSFLQVEEIMA